MICACGIVPTLSWMRKRWWPKISCWNRIFSITSCGLPTKLAPLQRPARVEVLARHRRPAALAPDPVHHGREGGKGLVGRVLRGVGDVAVRVDAQRQAGSWPACCAGPGGRSANGAKRSGIAADDRERHRQARARRLGRPTAGCRRPRPRSGAGPGAAADRRRVSSAGRWRPGHVTRSLIAQREQQLELLREQLVVVVEVVAEQRERLDERAAPGHDLGPPAGQEVERRELLEDADRIVGAEHGDGARQADVAACAPAAAASTTAGAETAKSGR